MEELIQEFTATDEDGNEYPLLVYQEFVPVRSRKSPSASIPGLKRITTEEGESVNCLEKGKYEIVVTGVLLESSDPAAP